MASGTKFHANQLNSCSFSELLPNIASCRCGEGFSQKLGHSARRGAAEGGSHPRPAAAPQATNYGPGGGTSRQHGAPDSAPTPASPPAAYAAASGAANELAFATGCDAPRMMIEALFAAACNAFDDKWL
jgi:hypothetical protein